MEVEGLCGDFFQLMVMPGDGDRGGAEAAVEGGK